MTLRTVPGGPEAAAGAPGSLPAKELQELWFATRRRDWTTLAVVPAWAGGSALPLAQGLRDVAALTRRPARLVRAEGLDLTAIATLVNELGSPRASSMWTAQAGGPHVEGSGAELTVIAVEPVVSNPLVLPIALAADAVLVLVELGTTDLASARHTVELLGQGNLLGSVLVRPR